MTNKWRVPYVDLAARYAAMQPELDKAVEEVFKSGRFVGGEKVAEFEQAMAAYLGVEYVVGVGNGYDALYLSLKALDMDYRLGDEVITVSHTFVATLAAIVNNGAKPVLIDVGPDGNMDASLIEGAITECTRAILPVHMNGRACDMGEIMRIAKRYGLFVIEDAAQAIGAHWQGRKVGTFGKAGCFSMHPLKTLSVAGDGGFVATDDANTANKIRILRNHGQDPHGIACFGVNSRLDALQACIGTLGLARLDAQIVRRRQLACRYMNALYRDDFEEYLGYHFDDSVHEKGRRTFSSFAVRALRRDALRDHLADMGIETMVHWPVPLHKQSGLRLDGLEQRWPLPETERLSSEVLSLPIYPEMKDTQQEYVIDCVKRFYER